MPPEFAWALWWTAAASFGGWLLRWDRIRKYRQRHIWRKFLRIVETGQVAIDDAIKAAALLEIIYTERD